MPRVIIYDSGPLGRITKAKGNARRDELWLWHVNLSASGALFAVPEIAYYEVRRELFRADNGQALLRLRYFRDDMIYLPITTPAMDRAAELWALARTVGRQGASDGSLDADCILAAQAELAKGRRDEIIIATDNLKHFEIFPTVTARPWADIKP